MADEDIREKAYILIEELEDELLQGQFILDNSSSDNLDKEQLLSKVHSLLACIRLRQKNLVKSKKTISSLLKENDESWIEE